MVAFGHVTLFVAPGKTGKGLARPGDKETRAPMNVIIVAPEDDARPATRWAGPVMAGAGTPRDQIIAILTRELGPPRAGLRSRPRRRNVFGWFTALALPGIVPLSRKLHAIHLPPPEEIVASEPAASEPGKSSERPTGDIRRAGQTGRAPGPQQAANLPRNPRGPEPSPEVAASAQLLTQLLAHRGAYLWTSRPTHGFADLQDVRIIDARDLGPHGIQVTVEGLRPGPEGETLARVTIPAAHLAIPGPWTRAPARIARDPAGPGSRAHLPRRTRPVGRGLRGTSSPDSGPAELEP